MSKGYVYILSNPHMPGLVKVGKTTRSVGQRAEELFQTGVPSPFKIEHEVLAPDCNDLEVLVHHSLSNSRVTQSREFFKCSVAEAMWALDQAHRDQISEWVSEFIPDHTIVDTTLYIDEADILMVADKCGEHPAIIAASFYLIAPDDIKPAITSFKAKKQRHEPLGNVVGLSAVASGGNQ